MPGMSDKKYSVFISSTYEDLKDERTAVLRAILQHGHFPLGMELWGAADEQQWQIIQRQIDVADYYVVIVAHRYGSLSDTGVSWTEREYDYAVEKGVPVLGFVQKGGAWLPEFVDKGENAERLEGFRARVQTKPVSFWSSADQLRTEVVLALGRQVQSIPRIGWVRGSEAVTSETAAEIARLSKENAELRRKLADASSHSLPNVSFEVESVTIRGTEPESFGLGISVDIELNSTLHRGEAVGIKDGKGVSLELQIPASQPIRLKGSVGSFHQEERRNHLLINGPTNFWIEGRGDAQEWSESWFDGVASVAVRLTPIGHSMSYRIVIPLKPCSRSARRDHDQLWELDSSREITQELI